MTAATTQIPVDISTATNAAIASSHHGTLAPAHHTSAAKAALRITSAGRQPVGWHPANDAATAQANARTATICASVRVIRLRRIRRRDDADPKLVGRSGVGIIGDRYR